MGTKMEAVKYRLYDETQMRVSDVKMFPGSSRDVTPEQMADQLNKVIAQLTEGKYELVEESCD